MKTINDDHLLYMVYDILEALEYLKKFNRYHGDINPNLITFDEEQNYYLIDRITLE